MIENLESKIDMLYKVIEKLIEREEQLTTNVMQMDTRVRKLELQEIKDLLSKVGVE